MLKRILALVLSFTMVVALLPLCAFAEENSGETVAAEETQTNNNVTEEIEVPETGEPEQCLISGTIPMQVNPLYVGLVSLEDIPAAEPVMLLAEPEYGTTAEAETAIREGMKARAPLVVVYVQTVAQDVNALFKDLLFSAMDHTGVPTEGDYLAYQLGSYGGRFSYKYDTAGNYFITFQYDLTYYDTFEQQEAMDAAVTSVLNQLNLAGKSDYEKICGIYDWMCDNITYDYTNLENESYLLKYTAYAALINRTAVCQGYANLFYRLALELGVDSRIISGTGITNNGRGPHAWNIVKLKNSYYDVDATWDTSWRKAGLDYKWFLKNETDFSVDHVRDDEYNTAAFLSAYPMGTKDYVLGYGTCGADLTWMLDGEGVLTVSGTGEMYDYSAANAVPWSDLVEDITTVVLADGVTSIGNYAFHGCRDLLKITLPDTLLNIGSNVFYSCNALTEICIPASVTEIENRAFAWCTSLTDIFFEGDAPQIASRAFYYVTATATYLSCKTGWTEDMHQDYGGTISWTADCSKGHAEITDEAEKATCTTDGLTEGKHCAVCGEILVKQEVIPAGHSVENGICTVCKVYGTCGAELIWTYEDGTLTITGEGEMDGYYPSMNRPWDVHRSDIETVVIEQGVTKIGAEAFYDCQNMSGVTIPDSVTAIGRGAFANCNSLTGVMISEFVTDIGDLAFHSCCSLTEITVDAANEIYSSDPYGVLFDKEKTTLIAYPAGKTGEYGIPDSVGSIGLAAFSGCDGLTGVMIPASVTGIADDAFANCGNLSQISFEGDAPEFGSNVFADVTATAEYPAGNKTWTEDVMQQEGGITWIPHITGVSALNGIGYATVAEALAAAESGDTVQLLQDTAEENVMVLSGVALDLNGCKLQAEYVFVTNSAHIVDNSKEKTGLLLVDENCVLISKSNAQLPVWNGEGYVFTKVRFQAAIAHQDSENMKYVFLPLFQNIATDLLKDGVTGNKVTIEVQLSWKTTQGREYRNLVYNDGHVSTAVTNGGALTMTCGGLSKMKLVEGITIEAVAVSETGVRAVSAPIVVEVT